MVVSTLNALGLDVIDLDLSTTPTVEMAVVFHKAAGGIILTASHNPKEWNALKLLNSKGEFISGDDGAGILERARTESRCRGERSGKWPENDPKHIPQKPYPRSGRDWRAAWHQA